MILPYCNSSKNIHRNIDNFVISLEMNKKKDIQQEIKSIIYIQ